METPWTACFCFCVSLPLLYVLWKHHPSYGANPSGPSFPLLGSLPFVLLNKHRLHLWTCELFARSHSLTLRFSIGSSPLLTTADPAVVQHILKSQFPHFSKGPLFYPRFAEVFGHGILNCDGPLWRLQRKVSSHVFSSESLRDFVVAVAEAEISKRLLPVLDVALRDYGGLVDLQALLMHFTFDTICQFTFGSDPACLDASKLTQKHGHGKSPSSADPSSDYGNASDCRTLPEADFNVPHRLIQKFVHSFQLTMELCAERFLAPDFVWKFKRTLKIGSEKKIIDAMQAVNAFTSIVIEQSKKNLASGKDRKDLLARFLRLSNNANEIPTNTANGEVEHGLCISDTFLKDILLCFIAAGQETLAAGVTFAMWLLSLHPRVVQEVLKEIDGVFEKRQLNSAALGGKAVLFTYDELRSMNYLQAVLSETMRLYPPVPFNCKFASQDDTFPDGTKIGKGEQVSYNVFAMGRQASIWGKDCLEFCPERWLNSSGVFMPVSPFKYPVFQAGPRMCLGKDFAFIQMKFIVASLVKTFEFVVEPGFSPNLSYGVTLLMVQGLPMTVKRRPS